MSPSPPKEPDVEQSAQSGEEQEQMDRDAEGAPGTGIGEFEVKEQDRWLPIANGQSLPLPPPPLTISCCFTNTLCDRRPRPTNVQCVSGHRGGI